MPAGGLFFQYGSLDARDLSIPVIEILGRHLTFRGYEIFEITADAENFRGRNGLSLKDCNPVSSNR